LTDHFGELMRLVMASANPDKVAEMAQLLSEFEIVARPPDLGDVLEDGDTLEDNARLKAVAVCGAAGEPAVSDDTGLEVDALGGAPGVLSARYAGVDAGYGENVDRLLREMETVASADRTARFRSVVMVLWPDGREIVAEGAVGGHISQQRRGSGGFGYDCVFVPDDGDGRTFAEMSNDEKHAISHRGRALRNLVRLLTR
jgi:XTP/dITP diphosphohydrolase